VALVKASLCGVTFEMDYAISTTTSGRICSCKKTDNIADKQHTKKQENVWYLQNISLSLPL